MGALITIDTLSRRDELDRFPRVLYRPRASSPLPELLDKAAAKWAASQGIGGQVRFEALDGARTLLYGAKELTVILGRVRSVSRLKNGLSRDISGVIEIRIS
ncbi:hypothetical protein ACQUXI_003916 [Cronobacter turicensis]|nr:hypothetical protein [Klebsiella pneumoniae]